MTSSGGSSSRERDLIFTRFDYADAWRLGSLLVELATERGLPVAIDIRRGAQQLFHAALAGSTADNDAWIERKVRVVERLRRLVVPGGAAAWRPRAGAGREPGVDPARFAAHGGAFPVRVVNAGVVAVVTVSGLPQAEDHALVVEAVERFR